MIVPSLPSMHTMKSQLQAAGPDIHLSKLSRRGSRALYPPPTYWNPSNKAPDHEPAGHQAPEFPDASSIIYTDGRAVENAQGRNIGAGVYCQQDNLRLAVNPCGVSATNTITRAELVAIYAALQQRSGRDCTIATDSLACMYIIGNALQEPRRCLELPHMILIQKISGVVLQRSEQGLKTSLSRYGFT